MDLEWQLDNPAIALGKYFEDTDTFRKKKAANDVLEDELTSKQRDLNSHNSELSDLQSRLCAMGFYEQGDIATAIEEVKVFAQKEIDGESRRFEEKKSDLSDKKDRDLQANDNWLKTRIEQLLGENADANRELNEMEKKALEFEIERRQLIVASDEKINGFEDSIAKEQLSCQTVVGELKCKQDLIRSKFEPDIEKFKKTIETINRKFQPDIRSCQNVVSEKMANRDEEIGQLQAERNREIQLANNEIDAYQREFGQTEKQFNEQIRMAKLQNKPTTRMENSKVSRLNAINDKIQKTNNRVNKKLAIVDQKIEVAQSKHAKQIEKAENELETVIRNRDQELQEPTRTYDGLIQDRDDQIAVLQTKIDQRENECNSRVSQNRSYIEAEKQSQLDNNNKIDQQIIEFVMSGDTCFSDILAEQNAPFVALQARINTWMEMLSCIKKDKLSAEYQVEREKQKTILVSKEYAELQVELSEATQYNDHLSMFARNNRMLTIAGGSLATLGIVLFIVLKIVLKMSIGLTGIFVIILGAGLMALTILKTKKEFSLLCKYVSLALDYQEFPCITSKSTKITQERELAKMKAVGNKLFDVHCGRTEAQNIHDAKDLDIKSDFERNLKLLKKEFENSKAQIERDRDSKIKNINAEASNAEVTFNSEKDDLQSRINSLKLKINTTNTRICELKEEIDSNSKFMEGFEHWYSLFEKQLDNEKWMTPMSFTHGKLNESLYIIPENDKCKVVDECNHRKVYRVNHNKKAIVVNYDISGVEDGRVEEINKIIRDLIFDLMYAVYRVNSKESYAQFVVDGNAATNDLKDTKVKNAFNIGEVVGKIDEMRSRIKSFSAQREKLAEKGVTMDSLNESKFHSQDRPETYNILYVIFKPEERKSKLDDEIRMLMPECEKYGFLPIFICEKDTWESGIQDKESIYKDIKGFANSEILVFNGTTYTFAS